MSLDPTGTQIQLRLERDGHVVTADIAQVGASLRGLTVDGVDRIARYPEGTPSPSCSGVVLVPWPNRVRDGQWTHEGEAQQLWITEPKLDNAIHGLLRYTPYTVGPSDSSVTLRATVPPQAGYPFLLETSVTYALTVDGITVTHSIRNSGATAAPVAVGVHPFIAVGDAPADQLTITSPGATYLTVDDRLLPTGAAPVTPENDLRDGRRLSDLTLDTAYTDLARDADGRVRHTLTDADGRSTTVWQDEHCDFVQFYTGRDYPGRDVALACEPMTAPAEALNSGTGLHWVDPDDTFVVTWGITAA
ncbi:aldose 1-epimerase family protein [Microbacterium gorillae]|uniref:aldose 1-epimerase family protein n=1 Tax=Microbacterium gorillae TaxID=1231063 RepID=UPI00058BC535|nr:aldose 1-epimerase family protein [Microbacterium gorillae]